jgi:hypothetical protein
VRLYVKLEVDYPDNPRIIAAGERAEVLYIRAMCLSKRTLSDGFIHDHQLPRFGLTGVKARAEALFEAGLWERVSDGYLIVGWLERNRSADDIHDQSAKRAEAGRIGGLASGASRSVQAKEKQSAS